VVLKAGGKARHPVDTTGRQSHPAGPYLVAIHQLFLKSGGDSSCYETGSTATEARNQPEQSLLVKKHEEPHQTALLCSIFSLLEGRSSRNLSGTQDCVFNPLHGEHSVFRTVEPADRHTRCTAAFCLATRATISENCLCRYSACMSLSFTVRMSSGGYALCYSVSFCVFWHCT